MSIEMSITKSFRFEAAHRLPRVPLGHPCSAIHGHSYRVEVTVSGPLQPKLGWVRDFADVSAAAGPLIAQLDHGLLNDVPGLENPTAERLALWLWDGLVTTLRGLSEIAVYETETACARYRGEAGSEARSAK